MNRKEVRVGVSLLVGNVTWTTWFDFIEIY